MLLVDLAEIILAPGNTFGWPKEKETARPQRIMEDREQPILQGRIQINQEIAAGNQVQLRKGRVLDHIMNRENAKLADLGRNTTMIALANEPPFKPYR